MLKVGDIVRRNPDYCIDIYRDQIFDEYQWGDFMREDGIVLDKEEKGKKKPVITGPMEQFHAGWEYKDVYKVYWFHRKKIEVEDEDTVLNKEKSFYT
jgi:hypothetical protein